jgi:hypothetical protein
VSITVDKASQRMSVVVDGALQWVWPVSTGTARYNTPNGSYTAFRMEEDHYSKEWDDAPMPHSIFFTRIGHAIHGTDHVRGLGRPASHGCVRLSRENAAMLFALVRQQGMLNTQVTISGELPPPPPLPPPPAVARRKLPVPAQDHTASVRRRMPAPELFSSRVEPPPHAAPEPPPQRAARAYAPVPPSSHRSPPAAERNTAYPPRRSYAAPSVIYDPRVEIIEETYVNGTWVRRRHYRQAQPRDFQRWR